MPAIRTLAERQRIWTISNFLSFTRVFFVIPVIYFLIDNTSFGNIMAIVFILLAGVTDWLDGYLARKLDQQSELGRVIDPLADKIGIAAVALYLSLFRDFPLWFLLLILGRDLIILVFGLLMTKRFQQVPESNWYGKVAVTAMAITMVVFILDVQPIKWPFFWIMAVLFFISVGVYVVRFVTGLNKAEIPSH